MLSAATVRPVAAVANQSGRNITSVTNCNDSGTGSLRRAVLDSASGSTITFALSPPCRTITLASTIHMGHNVTIDGPGSSTLSVNGDGSVDIFDIATGVSAKVAGLTIADGGGNYNGGGIYNNGTLTIAGSVMSLNSAAGLGGAISNVGGTLDVTESSLFANSAGDIGGGIFNDVDSTATVSDSTIFYDNADAGGGIANEGTLTVVNSTLSSDSATSDDGGGILNYSTLNVIDSTLSADNAGGVGGGVFNSGSASLAGTIVANSVVGDDCSGIVTDAGFNLDSDGSCGFTSADHSLSGIDPELGVLQENGGPTETESPDLGSPVLDQIPPEAIRNGTTLCSGTDQRGVPRPQGSDCDIGAVEMERDIATVGTPFSFTVTTFGSPVPSITEKGALPKHIKFTDNGRGTATLSGTPKEGGVTNFTIKAVFEKGKTRQVLKQVFTLTVDPASVRGCESLR